jgi:hypothetical protein
MMTNFSYWFYVRYLDRCPTIDICCKKKQINKLNSFKILNPERGYAKNSKISTWIRTICFYRACYEILLVGRIKLQELNWNKYSNFIRINIKSVCNSVFRYFPLYAKYHMHALINIYISVKGNEGDPFWHIRCIYIAKSKRKACSSRVIVYFSLIDGP